MNDTIPNVPWCVSNDSKNFVLNYLNAFSVGRGRGPPNGGPNNGVAAEAVGFKGRSVALRSSNGEAATEEGVEGKEVRVRRD
ncbi:hypothetical protein TNCV_1614631 [Trichonephila clavipes]|uniref:Uncharacterized protein n=1 Tax=Trichonephila clavipes TaxID=2585209 RepID=A0A8X6RUI5_TRICX|nr:hypothetical protein TNCV_1614631 [Trichonephila clavipes]